MAAKTGAHNSSNALARADANGHTPRKWTASWSCVSNTPIEKLWAVGSDFFNCHKWNPSFLACDMVKGDDKASAQPGSVRRIKALPLNQTMVAEGEYVFIYERLLERNDEEHLLRYTLCETFLGAEDYIATFKIDPLPPLPAEANEAGPSYSSCVMTYSMEVAPIDGRTEGEVTLFSRMEFIRCLNALEAHAKTLQD